MQRNTAAEKLAFAISGAGMSPLDIVKRENYATEAEYYVALGQAGAALEDPRVRSAILKAENEKRERAAAEERKAERERIREAAENWKLTPEEIDEIQSKAAAQAAREFQAGDLGPRKTIASRQRELYADMERKARFSAASRQAANDAIRAAWRAPTKADLEFTDRVINRPVTDPDSLD